jgi:dipeptidyl aminopeptidase/acylaminoacyl peptidase
MRKNLVLIVLLFALGHSTGAQQYFSAELMWQLGRLSDAQVSPEGTKVLYGVTNYSLDDNKGKRDLFVIPLSGGEPLQLTHHEGSSYNGIWHPNGKAIAYLNAASGSMQIWEMGPDGSNPRQVSDIEGGINGFAYSPDAKHILFTKNVKLDQSPADLYPDLPEANVFIADDLMYRHWDSWHDYTYSHIFVASYDDGQLKNAIDIMEGEKYDSPMKPWGGMEQIAWNHDGSRIAYTCKKLVGREWTVSTNSNIYVYDLNTNETINLTADNPGYDQEPVFSPDGSRIVWHSMATPGFEADKQRIMIHDFQTGITKDYSLGFDQSSSGFTWSNDGKTLYFVSGIHATYQLYGLDIESGKIGRITDGDHNYQSVAVAGDKLVGTKMSMSLPTEIFLRNINDGKETQLSFTNKHLLDNTTLATIDKRWVTTTDNKEMLVWVILPPDFDPKKKYPALLYCQGGPQSAVSQFFSYRWNFQMMAANGYVVVAPNRRGLPTFGQEWNDQISGDYGGQNMRDYLTAIDALSKEPWVDENHLGAIGASYGGYSVFWLAGHHQGRFKAFISHCGNFNLESMYASTEEYFFVNHDMEGPFWEDSKPKSYEFSPHLYVQNWDTPIMVIHGARDYRLPYTQSLQAFNAAQLRGIPSRLLFFPDESHFVLKPQNAVLWQNEFFRWLDQWLK